MPTSKVSAPIPQGIPEQIRQLQEQVAVLQAQVAALQEESEEMMQDCWTIHNGKGRPYQQFIP